MGEENHEAFANPKLELVIDDAKAWLERCELRFDVIIMDLDDPLEGGPCYQLYTDEFYTFLKSRLNPGGVLVTQSGQSGIKQHHLVFSPINRTLRDVFPTVVAYNQAVYSFMDEWRAQVLGWRVLARDFCIIQNASKNSCSRDVCDVRGWEHTQVHVQPWNRYDRCCSASRSSER